MSRCGGDDPSAAPKYAVFGAMIASSLRYAAAHCMHMRLPAAKCSRRPRLRSQRAAVETRGRNGTTPLLVVHLRLRIAEL